MPIIATAPIHLQRDGVEMPPIASCRMLKDVMILRPGWCHGLWILLSSFRSCCSCTELAVGLTEFGCCAEAGAAMATTNASAESTGHNAQPPQKLRQNPHHGTLLSRFAVFELSLSSRAAPKRRRFVRIRSRSSSR